MITIIRIRGTVKAKHEIVDTLKMLRLSRKHSCVIVNEKQDGMIKKVKDYITWGEISDDVLKKLIIKRARLVGNKRLDAAKADSVMEEIKTKPAKKWSIKPVFRLSPPSKGFHGSIRLPYPKGELGNRKAEINKLLEKMI
jgi:large subunit ribosomal protein L30